MKFLRWNKPVPPSRQFEGCLDSVNVVPSSDGSTEIAILGWAVDDREKIESLLVTINKGLPTEMREIAQYGLPRADVRSALPHLPHASNCGFRVVFRTPRFVRESIQNIEGTGVSASGVTLTRAFDIPRPKSIEDRLAAVELPGREGRVFGFLDNVSPCYIREGQTGLVARGWIVHAEKPIVGLIFVAQHAGQTITSSDVKYGLEHPDLVELLGNILPGGHAAFRAVFESGDFETDRIVSLLAQVTLAGGVTFETTFPPAIIPKTITTLTLAVCLPMRRPENSADFSDFCFANLASIHTVCLA